MLHEFGPANGEPAGWPSRARMGGSGPGGPARL